jgi:hypothetical protein
LLRSTKLDDEAAAQGGGDALERAQGDVGLLEGFDVGDGLLAGVKAAGEGGLAEALLLAQLGDLDGDARARVLALEIAAPSGRMELNRGSLRILRMEIAKVGALIYLVRGQSVMLDEDLACLYGVKTKQLSRAVKRNVDRFPADFMFQLTPDEVEILRCQFGTSSWGGRRYLPRAFTEQGVAMLSGVLAGARAVQVNIEIMRAFVRLRKALASSKDLAERMEKVEERLEGHAASLGEHAEAIRSVFEDIRALMGPPEGPKKRIGF